MLGDFSLKRTLGLLATCGTCLFLEYQLGLLNRHPLGPIDRYGYWYSVIFFTIKMLFFLFSAPLNVLSVLGTLFADSQSRPSNIEAANKTICFRVVTRGLFPELILSNLRENLSVLKGFESLRYTYEVVTDKFLAIDALRISKCYEVFVPSDYQASSGAKYKARALQYAIDRNVSQLRDDDWIVHLDEETLLTKSSINGIIKFIKKDAHQIGQGTIVYGKCGVVNKVNTLADCLRVGHDLGILRFAMKYLHRPFVFFKGSFLVVKHGAEKSVGFDNGMEGSIAEGAYFAFKASNQGFTFDWIEGEMNEKSPFTFLDFIKQRRRWSQGAYLIATAKHLKRNLSSIIYSLRFFASIFTPLGLIVYIVDFIWPVSFFQFDKYLCSIYLKSMWYLFWVGLVNSMDLGKAGLKNLLVYFINAPFGIHYWDLCESIAVVWAIATPKTGFVIVKKDQK